MVISGGYFCTYGFANRNRRGTYLSRCKIKTGAPWWKNRNKTIPFPNRRNGLWWLTHC